MLKAGIVGLGHGSRVLIDAFKLNNIEVVGIASKNFNKAKKIGEEKKIKKTYLNWKKLVSDKKIKIIAIAVPPNIQIEILNACLKNNKKIFCEKPLGTNFTKINNVLMKTKKINKFFLIDYIFREHEAFKKFNKLIKRTKINKNDSINVIINNQTYINKHKIINWKSNSLNGGGIVNLFLPHVVDYLVWFFGPVKKINCKLCKKAKNEISLECIFDFQSGIDAKIIINLDNPKKMHLIEYKSQSKEIILKNSGLDFGKKFKISVKKINKLEKSDLLDVKFNDLPSKFIKDSRILLTSRIIKKIKNNVSKNNQKNNLNRYQYNEYVLHCVRRSIKSSKQVKLL